MIATALAVNLRMAMYSASIAPYIGAAPRWQRALAAYFLTDQTYGVAISRYTRQPPVRAGGQHGLLLRLRAAGLRALVRGDLGRRGRRRGDPAALALDFAVPVTFIALVAPALRTLPHLAAAAGLGRWWRWRCLDALQPLAAGRRRRGDADRRAGRARQERRR